LSLFTELRRRNVFKVAIVYAAVAWLLLQVSDTLGPALHLPDWFISAVAFLLILGFPVAVIFAWAFELTPDGLKAETKSDADAPVAEKTGSNLNHIVVATLVLALGYFVVDKFMLGPDVAPAKTPPADQTVMQQNADNSIAVLPFVNMSSDEEQEYFSDGLSEELLNLLAGIPELKVAARTSSFSFKGKDLAIPDIASQLNVAHVLEGSVRKHGNQIRVTAQLIHADDGYHLWSETYDRQLDNVFQIQEDIAVAVVDALRITLLGEAPQVRKTDPRAYQLFLEGQYLKRQLSTDSLNQAVSAFKQAVEIDPSYVPAWAELADTYVWGGGLDELSREQTNALADQAVQIAISTDPDYAYAYYVRGITEIFAKNNFPQGIDDFEHAHELDPDNAFIVAAIGKGAFLTAKYDLAIDQYKAALAIEPIVPEFYWFLGRTYLSSGHLDEAEASFRKLSTLSSSFRYDYHLFEILLAMGDLEAALAESDSDFRIAITQFLAGNTTEADEALAHVIENSHPYPIALVYGFRGEIDKTFEWLDKSLEEGSYYPTWILTETAFRSIHADPRWEELLEKLGLLEYWLERSPEAGP
jgi:TolB-like protein/cytochrome c-type biogenesis protein CcmH/NrfG